LKGVLVRWRIAMLMEETIHDWKQICQSFARTSAGIEEPVLLIFCSPKTLC
jgi:hypothetical protein